MENKPTQRELFATPEDQVMAQKIVTEELGEGFTVDYISLPKNVGVIGDEGVRGHSLWITSDLAEPARFLAENAELLARLSIRLCNETSAASRVLFDFTPVSNAD
jgi:hypothetical protein